MVKIVVCEEKGEICRQLAKMKESSGRPAAGIISCTDAQAMMEAVRTDSVHQIILLIDLKTAGSSGISAAGMIQRQKTGIKVIFVADREESVMDIFQLNPSGFLLRPLRTKELLNLLDKALQELDEEDRDYFVVTFKGQIYRIRDRDILYFESQKRKVILHGREESWTVYSKLDEIQGQMPGYFLRCHQSYLVNMDAVKEIGNLRLMLVNGKTIPVSRPKFASVKSAYEEYAVPEQFIHFTYCQNQEIPLL